MSQTRGVLFNHEISRPEIEVLLQTLRSHTMPSRVLIHSPGGTFEFFSVLGPALQRQGFRSFAGNVASAAVILFLLGRQRYATRESTFFFHDVRAIAEQGQHITLCDVEEARERIHEMRSKITGQQREYVEEWARQMRMAQSWMLSFVQERTGLNSGVFANLMHQEATLSAREALRYGIVHRVVSFDQFQNDPSL